MLSLKSHNIEKYILDVVSMQKSLYLTYQSEQYMELQDVLQTLIEENKSDIFLFSASINDMNADKFINIIRDTACQNENCILILTTWGGDPDAGYRIMRALRRYYQKITMYVFGRCKSTGTLMALAADDIVMSDFGEFGPLDIQLAKDDELQNTSGLNIIQSLMSLNEQMFRSFEENFLALKRKSRHAITTRTAAEICSKLSVGLFSPISAQIDPHKFGETQRAINIAEKYGKRLLHKPHLHETLIKLMVGYPSHGFVIDFDEAKKLFDNVTWATDKQVILERMLYDYVRDESEDDFIHYMNSMITNETEDTIEPHVINDNTETINENIVTEKQQIDTDSGSENKKGKNAKKNLSTDKFTNKLKLQTNGLSK